MALPLDILDEIGQSYGPTRKLHQALANLVAATIQNLEHSRNGAAVQGVSFGSSTQSLEHPPMHIPLRIDSSFYKGSAPDTTVPSRNEILPSSMNNESRPTAPEYSKHPIASLPWPVNVLQSDMRANIPTSATADTNPTTTANLDDPMLWGSLEWTGGWDNFLNAIAM